MLASSLKAIQFGTHFVPNFRSFGLPSQTAVCGILTDRREQLEHTAEVARVRPLPSHAAHQPALSQLRRADHRIICHLFCAC